MQRRLAPIQLFRPVSHQRRDQVIQELGRASELGRDYVLLVLLSCIIASTGLALNSAAVIIGAMLISPLMSPILGLGLAVLRTDVGNAGRALATLTMGVILSVAVSAMLGAFPTVTGVNFLEALPSEIVTRTRPTAFDLAVALAGGAAAAYALAQPNLSAALPGVAIATALMPPLCVVGLGIGLGRPDISVGAGLLFLANFVAITFAGSIVFRAVGFPSASALPDRNGARIAQIIPLVLLLLVAVPLVAFTAQIIRDVRENQAIHSTLVNQLSHVSDSTLVGFDKSWTGDHLNIVASIRSPEELQYQDAIAVQEALAERLDEPVALVFLIVPVTRLDPLAPPTHTPRPEVARPPTTSPTPTHTALPSPTALPTYTPAPTATTVPTATPVSYAVIGATGGRGVFFRHLPGMSPIVTALRDGTRVQLTGERVESDGRTWVEVILEDGRVGWVAESYLVPLSRFQDPATGD